MGTKITDLTEKTLPTAADIITIVDSAGSPVTKKASIGNILANNYIPQAYGLEWDSDLDEYTRLGGLAGIACSQSLSDALLPIQAQMRRCVVSDAGVVQYYLDPLDSTKKADGTAANLDGTDGQVMVEIPKFWYRYEKSGYKHRWWISPVERSGYDVHPAFIKGAVEYDYRYYGAYPGTLYDVSASAYVDGDDSGTLYAAGDKLSSISGIKPYTNETRATYRTAAAARGTGWHQLDFALVSAVQLLYLIEYGDFNSQLMISAGNSKFSSFVFATCIGATGKSNGDGNASGGQSTTGGNIGDYVTYRGIEDIFGNLWQFLDGINIRNYDPLGGSAYASYAYLCADPDAFADDTDTDYDVVPDETLAKADGYISALIATKLGFLPKSIDAGNGENDDICDYYYTVFETEPAGGWRVVHVGGLANDGGRAGVFCVHSYSASSGASSRVGARLCR
jgi:hypothetical protein